MKQLRDCIIPLLVVLIIVAYFFVQQACIKDIDSRVQQYRDKLGEQFILEKDTLTIIDYNSFRGVFILSDGREINFDMVK